MKKELLAAILLLQLAACGGGGGGGGGGNNNTPNPNPNPVPEEPNEPEEPVVQPRTLTIQNMAWLQVVQQDMDDEDAVLASNKETRVRVDVVSERNNEVLPVNSALRLCSAPTTCESFTLTPNAINAPQAINDANLNGSYVSVIPANKMLSNITSFQVHVDTTSPAEPTNPLFKTGPVVINDIRTESIVVRQVTFNGQTGVFPSNADLKSLLERTYPHSGLTVTSAETIVSEVLADATPTSIENGIHTFPQAVLDEFMNEMDLNYCREENSGSICVTAWPDNVRFTFGPGFIVGGYANGLNTFLNQSFTATDNLSVASPYEVSDWLSHVANIFVHEFGHMMNLGHAACNVDPDDVNVGYPDGRIGTNGGGFDVGRNFYFSTAGGQFSDFMSYCAKNWTSDINYRQVIKTQRNDSDEQITREITRARLNRDNSHDHTHSQQVTTKQYLGFYRLNGKWVMKLVDIEPNKLKPFNGHRSGASIHPALKGLSLKSVQTHFGQPETGPFFVPATVVLKSLISEGPLSL
ncbi:MAG: hypothetical protein U0998_05945 [Moraxellaceae bacterium]|nr:hypothetical protein [Moraxellaceae bacterium]MDZ4386749.1 hypothetical protein [Moraxellaceae bacterium]